MKKQPQTTLHRCDYCGRENCLSHKKYYDRCVECGNRYSKYTSYKSQQRTKYSGSRAALLSKLEAEYIDLRDAGHKVPRDMQI